MIKIKAIDHINMVVNDLDESSAFYKKVFGFEIVEDSRKQNLSPNKLETPYIVLGVKGAAYLALHQSLQEGNGQKIGDPIRISHFGFHVDDFQALIQKLKAASVNFLHGEKVFEWTHSRSLYILDPNGHEIELVECFGGREDT